MQTQEATVIDLPRMVEELPPEEKKLFHPIFRVQAVTGHL